MLMDDRINLLARIARAPRAYADDADASSILSLAAASWGSRPTDESTIPTGFDPAAAQLFESIVEAAYLVATADGLFDDDERALFERIVTVASGGSVPQRHIAELVNALSDQLEADGPAERIARLVAGLQRPEHAAEVLRIAVLIAQVSEDVSEIERAMLEALAAALKLESAAIDAAVVEVKAALARAS